MRWVLMRWALMRWALPLVPLLLEDCHAHHGLRWQEHHAHHLPQAQGMRCPEPHARAQVVPLLLLLLPMLTGYRLDGHLASLRPPIYATSTVCWAQAPRGDLRPPALCRRVRQHARQPSVRPRVFQAVPRQWGHGHRASLSSLTS